LVLFASSKPLVLHQTSGAWKDLLLRSSLVLFGLDSPRKENDDGYVDDQHSDLDRCWTAIDFVGFKGNERAGGDDGKPLGPMLEQPEADAFGEEDPGIKESSDSECADSFGGNAGQLLKGEIDVSASRIESKAPDPVIRLRHDVTVDQFEDADAGGNQQNRLDQLKDGDQPEKACLGGFRSVAD
jgi:hypothetical protein